MSYKRDRKIYSYFKRPKKLHTEIKHFILTETLKSSIGIANMASKGYDPFYKYIDYTYVDLFAGSGEFEDGKKGSIILALTIIDDHIGYKRGNVENYIDFFKVIAIEKDKENVEALDRNLDKVIKSLKNRRKIGVYIGSGNWENFSEELKKHLKNSTWGFVFADPFSTELNIIKFRELLEEVSHRKDILIFVNMQALRRLLNNLTPAKKEKIENFTGLTIEELQRAEDLSDAVRQGIERQFSDIKSFALGVAIPVSVNQRLRTMDYFYLVLLTGDARIANNFLEIYKKAIDKFYNINQKVSGQQSLFDIPPTQKDLRGIYHKYISYLDDGMSAFDFWRKLTSSFLSWKEIVKNQDTFIPTVGNTLKMLNIMIDNNVIDVIVDKGLYDLRSRRKKKLKTSINKREDLEAIQIKVIH